MRLLVLRLGVFVGYCLKVPVALRGRSWGSLAYVQFLHTFYTLKTLGL